MSECRTTDFRSKWIPDDLPDCRAISYGGIPTINLAYKLEETDMGSNEWEDYDAKIKYEQDDYMRNAITDRNLDIPFTEGDTPAYNSTRNSGALDVRYNGGRGTTDYMPNHSEMMIGQDPFAGEDTGLKLAELKKYTAQIARSNEPRFGYNNADEIPEQPWADPEISYAKKDAMLWTSKIKNIWQYPQFINIQTSHLDQVDTEQEAKNRIKCANRAPQEEIYGDQPQDAEGLVRRTQVGYVYDMAKFQAQTMDFQKEEQGQHRQAKQPDRFELLRNEVKDGHNIVDKSVKAKYFKAKLQEAMKTAVEHQTHDNKLHNSDLSRKVKSGKESEGKAIIQNIVETQKRNKEVMSTLRAGVHPTKDHGYLKRESVSLTKFKDNIKAQMVKGSKKDEDIGSIQRDIAHSMKLNKEDKSRLCASGLYNDVDRLKILHQIAHQHKTGCSVKNKCYKKGAEYNTETKVDPSAPTQTFLDDNYTHVKSTKLIEENPRSIKDYSHFTDDTLDNNISDTCRGNNRNRW